MSEKWRCTYVFTPDPFDISLPKTEYACPHPIDGEYQEEPFCIFHLPKPTDEETKRLDDSELKKANGIRKKFNQGLASIMAEVQSGAASVLDFRGFIFPQVNLTDGFKATADFSDAVFTHDVDFSTEVISAPYDYETFGSLIFSKGVKFVNARFIGKAIFSHITFHADADFRSASFEKETLFNGAVFEMVNDFGTVSFKENANFTGAHFKNLGQFEHATFTQKADFDSSIFDSGATFHKALFHARVDFDNAQFGKEPDSSPGNEVLKDEQKKNIYVGFQSTTFNGKASFEDTSFDGDVYFENAVFKNEARFISNRTLLFGGDCYFTGVALHKDAELVFFRVDLRRARFHDTNLESISFRDVQWACAQTRLAKLLRGDGPVLWDEIRPLDAMRDYLDVNKTAENYRQLVINYERKRDYESAEYFHIGEMEIAAS